MQPLQSKQSCSIHWSDKAVTGCNFIAISLFAIGIVGLIGLNYPQCPVAAFGNTLGFVGALGLLITSGIIFGATSLKPCFNINQNAAASTMANPYTAAAPVINRGKANPVNYCSINANYPFAYYPKFLDRFSMQTGIKFSGNYSPSGAHNMEVIPSDLPHGKAFIFYYAGHRLNFNLLEPEKQDGVSWIHIIVCETDPTGRFSTEFKEMKAKGHEVYLLEHTLEGFVPRNEVYGYEPLIKALKKP
jgi:hypothetical protein